MSNVKFRDLQNFILSAFSVCLITALIVENNGRTAASQNVNKPHANCMRNISVMNPEETEPKGDIIMNPLSRIGTNNPLERWPNGTVPYEYIISRTFNNRESTLYDISLMNPEETDINGDILYDTRLGRIGTSYQPMRWPNGIVPYTICPSIPDQYRDTIIKAMEVIQNVSCVQFVPRTHEQDYVLIDNAIGCKSAVGRLGDLQTIYLLAPLCFVRGPGSVIHELMHTLGFYHEQCRPDRDDYVRINYNNIADRYSAIDFMKLKPSTVDDFGLPYDFFSVMHYSLHAYSINNDATIFPLSLFVRALAPHIKIGQRDGLSDLDVLKLNRMYGCTRYSGRWYINGTCSGYTISNTTFYYSGKNEWYIDEKGTWMNIKNVSSKIPPCGPLYRP